MTLKKTMSVGEFQTEEAEVKIRSLANQVHLEVDGDFWYTALTLNREAVEVLTDWLILYRMSQQV